MMRRKDKEVTDFNEIMEMVGHHDIVRLGLIDNGLAYMVPVNFGFDRDGGKVCFYFHGAKAGRKAEIIGSGIQASFEMDRFVSLIEGNKACDYGASFESVMGTGNIVLLEDKEDKKKALDCLMFRLTGQKNFDFEPAINATNVYRFDVETISAKKKA